MFLHYGDLSDSNSLSRMIQHVDPDEVYNLGAQSHVAVSFEPGLAMRMGGPREALWNPLYSVEADRTGDPMSASAEGRRSSGILPVVWDIVCKSVGRG